MVNKEIITFTLEVEVNDLQAVGLFNARYDTLSVDNDSDLATDEREHVVRAAAMLVANAFTSSKTETGLQLRSIARTGQQPPPEFV